MVRNLLLLDDSATAPFWHAPGWVVGRQTAEFDRVERICGFSSVEECLSRVREVVLAVPRRDDVTWYVITDSNFGRNPRGGGELLMRLREDGPHCVSWARAVIFSENPQVVPGLIDCRSIHRGGVNEQLELAIILNYLIFEKSHNLASLREIDRDLRFIPFACETLACSLAGGLDQARVIRPMVRYGVPAAFPDMVCATDDLRSCLEKLSTLFSPESVELFDAEVEDEFLRGAQAFARDPERNYALQWQAVVDCLHPARSLERCAGGTGGRLRLLWEIVHAGGSPGLLRTHRYQSTEWLNIYQKASLSLILEQVGMEIEKHSAIPLLAQLCRDVVTEVETVRNHLATAMDGMRTITALGG